MEDKIREAFEENHNVYEFCEFKDNKYVFKDTAYIGTETADMIKDLNRLFKSFSRGYNSAMQEAQEELYECMKTNELLSKWNQEKNAELERLKWDHMAILGMCFFNENLSKKELLSVISDIKEIGIKYRDNWEAKK